MKKTDILKLTGLVLSLLSAAVFSFLGVLRVRDGIKSFSLYETRTFFLDPSFKDDDGDEKRLSRTEFRTRDGKYTLVLNMSENDREALSENAQLEGDIYKNAAGSYAAVKRGTAGGELERAKRDVCMRDNSEVFGYALALALFGAGLAVMFFFGRRFSVYEQCWFTGISAAAAAVSIIAPEEEVNGISGLVIMALYLADTFLNILCELLISKQSRWNFIVSVFVEITEILICVLLAYRFATLAATLLFWLPIDIISFVSWSRHPDRAREELTVVRALSGRQEVLVILGIVAWTVGVGFFLTTLDFGTDLFGGSRTLEVTVCFLDAAASAVGIANGVFILLRLREQWIAWFIDALLETAINILSGQYVLLVLKAGYLTNTAYGYIKWTKYIKKNTEMSSKSV